jgi:hypothetical protein
VQQNAISVNTNGHQKRGYGERKGLVTGDGADLNHAKRLADYVLAQVFVQDNIDGQKKLDRSDRCWT